MKDAENIQYKMSQLLDGQLPEREAQALRARIEADPALAREFRLYQALDSRLAEGRQRVPQVDWAFQRENIRAELERDALLRQPARVWPGVLLRWSAGISAAAAAILLLVTVGHRFLYSGGQPALQNLAVVVAPPSQPNAEASASLVMPQRSARAQAAVVSYATDEPSANATALIERDSAFSGEGELVGTVVVSAGPPRAQDTSGGLGVFGEL